MFLASFSISLKADISQLLCVLIQLKTEKSAIYRCDDQSFISSTNTQKSYNELSQCVCVLYYVFMCVSHVHANVEPRGQHVSPSS